MRYFANPSTAKVRDAMRAGLLDCIYTPKQGNKPLPGVAYCADNGAFGKGYPGDEAWFAWAQRLVAELGPDLSAFVVAPDVPFDALTTLDKSMPWLPLIRALGVPAAVVAQNGFEDIPVIPWDQFDVLFLGGTMECRPCGWVRPVGDFKTQRCVLCNRRLVEWKLGPGAARAITEAKAHGLTVHMGRVNSEKRYLYAAFAGCDSADGTYIKWGPDVNLPKTLGWLDARHDQLGAAS